MSVPCALCGAQQPDAAAAAQCERSDREVADSIAATNVSSEAAARTRKARAIGSVWIDEQLTAADMGIVIGELDAEGRPDPESLGMTTIVNGVLRRASYRAGRRAAWPKASLATWAEALEWVRSIEAAVASAPNRT